MPSPDPVIPDPVWLVPLYEIEAAHIARVLRHCRNNQKKAASILGISVADLRIRRIECNKKAFDRLVRQSSHALPEQ